MFYVSKIQFIIYIYIYLISMISEMLYTHGRGAVWFIRLPDMNAELSLVTIITTVQVLQ